MLILILQIKKGVNHKIHGYFSSHIALQFYIFKAYGRNDICPVSADASVTSVVEKLGLGTNSGSQQEKNSQTPQTQFLTTVSITMQTLRYFFFFVDPRIEIENS